MYGYRLSCEIDIGTKKRQFELNDSILDVYEWYFVFSYQITWNMVHWKGIWLCFVVRKVLLKFGTSSTMLEFCLCG